MKEIIENHSEKSPIRGCLETIGLIVSAIATIGFFLYGTINEDMKYVVISLIFAFSLIILVISYRRKMKETEDETKPLGDSYDYIGISIADKYALNTYEAVRSFSEYLRFIQYRTEDFFEWLQSQNLPISKENDMQRIVQAMILSDIQTGFLTMETPLDLRSKEGFALFSLINYFNTDKYYDIEEISNIKESAVLIAQEQAEKALNAFNSNHEKNKLILPKLLKDFNEDAYLQYMICLYRFFSIAAKADDVVTEKETGFLKEIMSQTNATNMDLDITKDVIYSIGTMLELTDLYSHEVVSIGDYIVRYQYCKTTDFRDIFECSDTEFYNALAKLEELSIIKRDGIDCEALVDEIDFVRILRGQKTRNIKQGAKTKRHVAVSNEPAINQLEQLIGLDSVKKDVKTLANFVKIQKQREEKGLKASSASYHCVFTGNPGTGKTTVARIVASIYKELGVLKEGHLVETDRSGLVAEYVGQTAVKTNKIIDSALDGVLFIDEAYTLAEGGSSDYGSEAIATLLKRMEDDRDRLVVIIAGYTKNMQNFINSNPGLQSRFTRYIKFPDYSADELMQIFEMHMRKYDYHFGEGAKEQLQNILDTAIIHKDENFGNGRFVRNVFEKILQHQADRLASMGELTSEQLSRIEKEDLADL